MILSFSTQADPAGHPDLLHCSGGHRVPRLDEHQHRERLQRVAHLGLDLRPGRLSPVAARRQRRIMCANPCHSGQ